MSRAFTSSLVFAERPTGAGRCGYGPVKSTLVVRNHQSPKMRIPRLKLKRLPVIHPWTDHDHFCSAGRPRRVLSLRRWFLPSDQRGPLWPRASRGSSFPGSSWPLRAHSLPDRAEIWGVKGCHRGLRAPQIWSRSVEGTARRLLQRRDRRPPTTTASLFRQ